MKKIVITALLVFSVAAAASTATAASDATKNASAACTALRAKMGAAAFAQAYATFGRCVSSMVPLEQQNVNSANAACTAEQADPNFVASHGGKTFDQFYGTGKKGRNAFGNCVSTKAKASSQAEQQARPNPSRTCRAQRTAMGATAFAQLYGKNASDKNAFGKCVSKAAHSQTQNELTAAASCRAEQSDPAFAASHSGKTFAQFYGTGDLANAFGKCVSAKARASAQSQQQATVKAAKSCLAEQKSDPSAFKAKYRTFGRCVSAHANGG